MTNNETNEAKLRERISELEKTLKNTILLLLELLEWIIVE